MESFCATCDSIQEVEATESFDTNQMVFCVACGEEFVYAKSSTSGENHDDEDKYKHYKIGRIMKVEPVAKSKDLKLCSIDVVGSAKEEDWLPVVTNAKYAEAGWKVVVACVGAIVPAGAAVGEDPDAIEVAKRNVQGVESKGMVCDCWMLRWTGGAKGIIQQLPDSFQIGDRPPESRPRI